jgi:hypothetical protein
MTEIEKTGVEIEDISESEAYKNAFRAALNYNGGSESVFLGDFLNCVKYMYSVKEKRIFFN